MSGDSNPSDTSLSIKKEEKVLGILWDSRNDAFKFKVRINFSHSYRKMKLGRYINKEEIETAVPKNLSRRMVLSQIASLYDPLGLLVPVTLEAKELMRHICLTDKDPSVENTYMWDMEVKRTDWKYIYRRLAPAVNDRGQVVVGFRMAEWLRKDWNNKVFILLPYKHRYSWLYVKPWPTINIRPHIMHFRRLVFSYTE